MQARLRPWRSTENNYKSIVLGGVMSRNFLLLLSAILALLVANGAHATLSAFLCVTDPGFQGEATASFPGIASLAGCSDLLDFGQTGFIDGSASIARDLKLDKTYDSMSNPLRAAMVNGTTLNEVKVRVIFTNGGGAALEFWDLRLLGARVDSAAMSLPSGGAIGETVGFNAANIDYTYRVRKSDGTLGQTYVTCWDVANQTATASACP